MLPHLIQQHSIEQNRTSSIGDLISSVPDALTAAQQTKELENLNSSVVPVYTQFRLGHIVTGEVSKV